MGSPKRKISKSQDSQEGDSSQRIQNHGSLLQLLKQNQQKINDYSFCLVSPHRITVYYFLLISSISSDFRSVRRMCRTTFISSLHKTKSSQSSVFLRKLTILFYFWCIPVISFSHLKAQFPSENSASHYSFLFP